MKPFAKIRQKFKLPKTDRQKAMGALITDLKLLDILCHGIPAIGNPIKAAVSAAIQLLEGTEVRLIPSSLGVDLHLSSNTRPPKATQTS